MTTQNLPTLTRRGNATQCSFSLMPNTQTFESPLNRAIQTYELPGARWILSATWQNLCETDARIFKAWLAKLRGAAGRFYGYDLSYRGPRGTANADGTVFGAGQTGGSIVTAWAGATITGWLMPGDYVEIAGELKIVTAQVDIDGSNHATIAIEPPMRTSPANGSAVDVLNPTAVFRLENDEQDGLNFDPDRHPSLTITAVEVIT